MGVSPKNILQTPLSRGNGVTWRLNWFTPWALAQGLLCYFSHPDQLWGQVAPQIEQAWRWSHQAQPFKSAWFSWENENFLEGQLRSRETAQALWIRGQNRWESPAGLTAEINGTLVVWPSDRTEMLPLINEAYLAIPLRNGVETRLGRFYFFEHEWDQTWWLGLLEPMGAMDPLRQQPQGLTGLSLGWKQSQLGVKLLFSPLSLPGMDPPVRNENGKLYSPSIWFQPPVNQAVISNKTTPVSYQLLSPDLNQLFNHPTLGFETKFQSNHWMISAGWLSSPLPQVLTEYDYFLKLQQPTPVVQVNIRPFVGFHQITSIQAEWSRNDHSFKLSIVWEKVKIPPAQNNHDSAGLATTDWVRTVPHGVEGISATWRSKLTRWNLDEIQIGALFLNQNRQSDTSTAGETQTNTRSYRFPWSQAIKIRITKTWLLWGLRLQTSTGYLRDFASKGNWLENTISASWKSGWMIQARLDLLGVDPSDSQIPAGNSFFQDYRSFDRLLLGIAYAF